jgi:hypothetical protein
MAPSQPRRGQGFWLTVSEIVGVLALVIAGLNLWESHQQRIEDHRRAATTAQAETAFVATGQADRTGAHVVITPLSASQAIQSQSYVFPSDLLSETKEISAARPQIEAGWIAQGLEAALNAAHVKGPGHGHVPVVISTTYVEDGDERSDTSLYRIGYAWRPRFLGGEQIRLEGLALVRRGLSGDSRAALDARWNAERPRPAS